MEDNILPEQQNLLGGFSVAFSAPCFNSKCFLESKPGTELQLTCGRPRNLTTELNQSHIPCSQAWMALPVHAHWGFAVTGDERTAGQQNSRPSSAEVKLLSAVSKGLVPCLQHRGCYRRVIKRHGVCHLDSQNSWHSISAKILLPVHWEIRRKTNKQTTSIHVSILIAQLGRNLLKLISWS